MPVAAPSLKGFPVTSCSADAEQRPGDVKGNGGEVLVDQAGHTQPGSPVWNRLGYGNNAVQDVSVTVTG